MKILKFLTIFLLAVLTSSFLSLAVEAPSFNSNAMMLLDLESNEVIYAKNANERVYPASLTKIMTALVILDLDPDFDEVVTVTGSMLASLSEYGSTASIKEGEELTIRELLECMLISSANEAANILAEHCFGSVDAFVIEMNRKAAALGCTGTHFANPHGLHDEEHYTTVTDLSLIVRDALKYEAFVNITSQAILTQKPTNLNENGRTLVNTNNLITKYRTDEYYYPAAVGIKTGFTTPAGHCLITTAKKGELHLLSIVMGAKENEETGTVESFTETVGMLEWGFDNFTSKVLITATEPVLELPVTLAKDNDYVVLAPESSITAIVPKSLDPAKLERIIDAPESAEAPVKQGDSYGTITLKDGDKEYGTLKLIAMSGAERSTFLHYLKVVKNALKEPAVVKGILIFFSVIGVYILLMIVVNLINKKKKRRRRRKKAVSRKRERETTKTK